MRKYLFDNVVKDYAEARPGYPVELMDDIITICGLTYNDKVLEIGCGTGQATQLFVDRGFEITAVELGKNLTDYTRERFKNYSRIRIFNQAFEEFQSNDRFKLIFAASAFHWIDPERGFPLISSLLQPDGCLALFWNSKSELNQTGMLFQKINEIYDKYYVEPTENIKLSHEEREQLLADSGLFQEVICKKYPYTLQYTSEKYIQLLGTYSDHIAQPAESKHILFGKIREIIEQYGGTITIPYEVKAYIAKR